MLSDEIVSVRVTLTVCDYSVNFLWIELMMSLVFYYFYVTHWLPFSLALSDVYTHKC